MNIKLTKKDNRNLLFILDQFILAHIDGGLYKEEIKLSRKILKKIKL